MMIRVTAEHIRSGNRGLPCSCALALAIVEVLPDSDPIVTLYGVVVRVHGRNVDVALPEVVIAFIKRFDDGEKPEPFEFELAI